MGPSRVRFIGRYVYTPSAERRVSVVYKAEARDRLVNGECAEAAIAAGKAVLVAEIPAPKVRRRRTAK